MKVAMLLTGYMRDWETHFPNTKENIIDKYNADVFISSYQYSELYKGSGMVSIDTKKVIDLYKPKKYLFQDKQHLSDFQFKENGLEINGREWSYRILQQWFTVYLGLFLFNPEDYDIIIRCRSDFSVKNFNVKSGKDIVIPAWKVHPGPCEPEESYVDCFAYGSGTYMKEYFKLYEKAQEMHNNDWGDVSLGETLIRSYIDRYVGSSHVSLDYEIDWQLRNEIWASEYRKIWEEACPDQVLKVPATEKDALILGGNLDVPFSKLP
jgi:hypothetical protein